MPRYYVTSHPDKVSRLMSRPAGERLAAKMADMTGERAELWETDYDESKKGYHVAYFEPSKVAAVYYVQRYADRKTIDGAKEFPTIEKAMVDVVAKEAKGFRLVVVSWDRQTDKGTIIYTSKK